MVCMCSAQGVAPIRGPVGVGGSLCQVLEAGESAAAAAVRRSPGSGGEPSESTPGRNIEAE